MLPRLRQLPSRVLDRTMRTVLGTVTGVATREPVAALTFDDGPHPEYTPRLLDVLAQHGAQGTFFMVGAAAAAHPALVERVAAAGHAVANHSWDHPSLPFLAGRERRAQVRRCGDVLGAHGQPLFRPPYGHQVYASRLDAWRLGYTVVAWSFHVEDWLEHDADWMADRIAKNLRPGGIVLMHDNLFGIADERYANRTAMLACVDAVLRRLGDRFRFVTVPDLLRRGRPVRKNWRRQADAAWWHRRTETGTLPAM